MPQVIGVGGGGMGAVARLIELGELPHETWSFNTESGALAEAKTTNRLQIGQRTCRGLGVDGNPELGREAALESYADMAAVVAGQALVIVVAGMGGGTGTGAAPVLGG